METDPLLVVEELLREIWQRQGCLWPGPQIRPPEPGRVCGLCRRNQDVAELAGRADQPCQFCHSGS